MPTGPNLASAVEPPESWHLSQQAALGGSDGRSQATIQCLVQAGWDMQDICAEGAKGWLSQSYPKLAFLLRVLFVE